jgi:hypothetical protein
MKALVRRIEALQIKKLAVGPFTCYTCKKEGHISRNCSTMQKINNRKSNNVNEVVEDDEMDDILEIKDSLVYLKNKKILAEFDSGVRSSFISKSIVEKSGLETHKNTKITELLTCLDEEFQFKEHVIVDMTYKNCNYRVKFHVLQR